MYSSESKPGELFKPKDNNLDINQLKQEISVLSDNFCRFKLLLKSYDKYFDYFNEILNTIEYNDKDLDLVKKIESLSDIKTNIKALKECEKSCFVCLEKLNENQFNQGIDCDISSHKTVDSPELEEKQNIDTIVYFGNKPLGKNKIQSNIRNVKKKKQFSKKDTKTIRKRKFTSISVKSEEKECTDSSDPDFELNGEQNSSNSEIDVNGQSIFRCNDEGCNYEGNHRKYFERHKRERHPKVPKVFTCDYIGCGKQFPLAKYLRKHQTIHQRIPSDVEYKCQWKDCTAVFNIKHSFARHMQRHRQKKTFVCTHEGCQYRGKTAKELSGHQISHSNDRLFICLITDCNKQFKNAVQLKHHQLRAHPQEFDEFPWFECTQTDCNFKTKSSKAIFQHKRLHTRPFVCTECQKRFANKTHLKTHCLTYHSPELSYRCDWPGCDRLFSRKDRFEQHLNGHTMETTYSCDWPNCDKTYLSKEILYNHIYQTHQQRHKVKKTNKLSSQLSNDNNESSLSNNQNNR